MERNWEKVRGMGETIYIKFDNPGDEIEGELLATREKMTAHGRADMVYLKTADNLNVSFVKTAGMGDLSECNIGDYVLVRYNGEAVNPKNNRRYKQFSVYVDDSPPL